MQKRNTQKLISVVKTYFDKMHEKMSRHEPKSKREEKNSQRNSHEKATSEKRAAQAFA